jgi:citrate synthase
MARALLTAEQAATRLGVKLQTLYAYVSRGVLSRTLSDDLRTSRFDASEVDALARRGRPRQGVARLGTIEVSIATQITRVQEGRLQFRGHDVRVLAAQHGFEEVSELLWSGELRPFIDWEEEPRARRLVQKIVAVLPGAISPLERFATVAAAIAPLFPLRAETRLEAASAHGRALLFAFAGSLPLSKGARPPRPGARMAQRLWPCLSALPATAIRTRLLDTALVLLADHELATSTVAARVAASTRANPFAVVLAGLGAMNGPLHGKAALEVHQLLLEAQASSAEGAVMRVVEAGRAMPGFGHPVYRELDPRAAHLMDALLPLLAPQSATLVQAVRRAAQAATSPPANVDFALGALAFGMRMPLGSTEAIFALARTSGLIAHALEEYGEEPLRFRARAIFVGKSS